MELLSHIKTLLRDHDRAFIPGFGGFVKEYVPASIDDSTDLFRPPTCTLSFNSQLAKEDGLLAERIMEEEGVNFEKAKERVQGIAQRWEQELSKKKRLELQGIGILYRDEEGATRFEPDPDPELEPSAYGLSAFYVTASKKEARSLQKPHEPEGSEIPAGDGTERRKTLLKAAAVLIPLLIILGIGAMVQLNKDRLNADLMNWSGDTDEELAYKTREKIDREAPSLPPLEEEEKREPPFSFSLSENGPVYTVLSEKAMKEKGKGNKKARFFVIGGCFEVKTNAEKRVRELSRMGFPARILDRKRKGLHVVAFETFADRNKALEVLRKAKDRMGGAWLLHRP